MSNNTMYAQSTGARTPVLPTPVATTPPTILELCAAADAPSTPKKRCAAADCRRKLTLTDFDCGKCKSRFCTTHRLPESHACSHDFRKDLVKMERVVADKLERI
jgi:hypothetical protein